MGIRNALTPGSGLKQQELSIHNFLLEQEAYSGRIDLCLRKMSVKQLTKRESI